MQRVVRVFDHFEDAEDADLEDWLALSGQERLQIGEEMRRDVFPGGRDPIVRCVAIRELTPDEE